MSPRPRVRALAVAVTALAVAALTAPAAHASTSSAPDSFTRSKGHKVVHYTVEKAAQARVSRNQLRYGGGVGGVGVTSGPMKVYLVFWGSQWGTSSTDVNGYTTFSGDSAGAAVQVQKMFKGLGTNSERWSNVMKQYCDGGVAAGSTTCPSGASFIPYPSNALAGIWYDNSTAAPGTATDHQLAIEAENAAATFGNTTAAANRYVQYVILSPTGTHPGGFNTPNAGWCAWHDYNGDTTLNGGPGTGQYGNLAFTNMPYVLDLGTSCGKNYVNAGTAGTLDGFTIVEGHEYAETITDQFPAGGWTSSSGSENADLCAWIGTGGTGGAVNVSLSTGNVAMQGTWSNLDSGCRNAR